MNKWDGRFLDMAKLVASWSKDPSTQTGAVIVDKARRVVSVGYNGFARGVDDDPARYANRDLKLKMVVHCERNAVLFAGRSVEGCTLYTWPFMSCAPCAAMMVQAGIRRVVAPYSDNERWLEDFRLSSLMFREAGVDVTLYQPDGTIVKGYDV